MEKSVPEYGYRSTIDVHRAPEGYYGFYKKKSNEILPVASCPVAEDALNRGISMVNSSCRSGEVAIKADNNGGIWISDHAGDRFFKDRFRGKELFFSPRAFSQANRYIAEKISVTLDEWIGSDTEDTVFFDLYCGVGFFSFLTERVFNVCVGIDESRIAIDCAKTTLKTTRAGACKFYRGVVEKDFFDLFDRNCLKRNIIFLDPPRKGASRKFLERLSGNDSIDRIYYLSCDPPRLARDTGIITSGTDFILNRIRLFDMFPRTTHIETLAEFTRKN
jgi:23S rRNA (uracil1939-C5)-methyltransferase